MRKCKSVINPRSKILAHWAAIGMTSLLIRCAPNTVSNSAFISDGFEFGWSGGVDNQTFKMTDSIPEGKADVAPIFAFPYAAYGFRGIVETSLSFTVFAAHASVKTTLFNTKWVGLLSENPVALSVFGFGSAQGIPTGGPYEVNSEYGAILGHKCGPNELSLAFKSNFTDYTVTWYDESDWFPQAETSWIGSRTVGWRGLLGASYKRQIIGERLMIDCGIDFSFYDARISSLVDLNRNFLRRERRGRENLIRIGLGLSTRI